MRRALLIFLLPAAAAGCLDFSVDPGALRCDPALDPPCPHDWLCLLEASADRNGRCYPPDLSGDDGRLVGPRAAPDVSAPGRRFFVDPKQGSSKNPGSAAAPWRTLAEVIAAGKIEHRAADGTLKAAGEVKAGDALVLRDGEHGKIDLSGYFNQQRVYVLADAGARPRLSGVTLRSGRGWWFQGLTIQKSGCGFNAGLVTLGEAGATEGTSVVTLVGNRLRSTDDASGWTKDDWSSKACTGVQMTDVQDLRAAFNELRNVREGFHVRGKKITLERNRVDGFCGQAVPIKGNTRGVKILSNLIENAYTLGGSGSQTLIHGSNCTNCGDFEIRGNRLLPHRDPQVPASFRKPVQGIGLYAGGFDKIAIVNNLVIGQSWNGIHVLGGTDVEVLNNTTVMGAEPRAADGPTETSIKVTGTLSSVTVRNNLTNKVDVVGGGNVDHNADIYNPATYFVDWSAGDYRPREGGPAVDGGSTKNAPVDDLFGQPRDGKPDLGAIER